MAHTRPASRLANVRQLEERLGDVGREAVRALCLEEKQDTDERRTHARVVVGGGVPQDLGRQVVGDILMELAPRRKLRHNHVRRRLVRWRDAERGK